VKINSNVTTIVEFNNFYGTSTLDDYVGSGDIYLLELPDDWTGTVLEFANELAKDTSRVNYAEPNFLAEAPEDPAGDARMKARSITVVPVQTR
jgi:hypothetical protein